MQRTYNIVYNEIYGDSYYKLVILPKSKARTMLNRHIHEEKIKRQPCEICNKENAEGHHPDYNEPLSIAWLCRLHHRELHKHLRLE